MADANENDWTVMDLCQCQQQLMLSVVRTEVVDQRG